MRRSACLGLFVVVAACSSRASQRVQRQDPPDATVDGGSDGPPAPTASPEVADAGQGTAVVAAVDVVDAPLAWSDEREALTLAYRRAHSDAAATDLTIEPRVIILHYTAGREAAATRRYFDNVKIEASRTKLAKAGAVNVSAHYIVDRDGTIYQLQAPTRYARHCVGLNHIAIGIENVGDEDTYPLTDAQVVANAALVRSLAARFPITHLLGHHEVDEFREHAYYVELDAAYTNTKPDPGAKFMAAVRARVDDLELAREK